MGLFCWPSRATFTEAASPKPTSTPPKVFSTPVTDGYVDDQGKWFATKDEADLVSAMRHMQQVGSGSVVRLEMSFGEYFDRGKFADGLRQPDAIAAMAIIARVSPTSEEAGA